MPSGWALLISYVRHIDLIGLLFFGNEGIVIGNHPIHYRHFSSLDLRRVRLTGLQRPDAVGAHHLIVLMFHDMAMPDVLTGCVELGPHARHLAWVGDHRVLDAGDDLLDYSTNRRSDLGQNRVANCLFLPFARLISKPYGS